MTMVTIKIYSPTIDICFCIIKCYECVSLTLRYITTEHYCTVSSKCYNLSTINIHGSTFTASKIIAKHYCCVFSKCDIRNAIKEYSTTTISIIIPVVSFNTIFSKCYCRVSNECDSR